MDKSNTLGVPSKTIPQAEKDSLLYHKKKIDLKPKTIRGSCLSMFELIRKQIGR